MKEECLTGRSQPKADWSIVLDEPKKLLAEFQKTHVKNNQIYSLSVFG
jgi:hypothetical protein